MIGWHEPQEHFVHAHALRERFASLRLFRRNFLYLATVRSSSIEFDRVRSSSIEFDRGKNTPADQQFGKVRSSSMFPRALFRTIFVPFDAARYSTTSAARGQQRKLCSLRGAWRVGSALLRTSWVRSGSDRKKRNNF